MMSLDNRHALALPYWARPGLRFAKTTDSNDRKAAKDDDDDEESDDDDDDDDEDDEDDPDEGKTDDEIRAELKATRERLKKANDQSARKRRQLREARKPAAAKTPAKKKTEDDDDDKPDVEAIVNERLAAAREASDTRVKRASIRSSLKAAGVPDARLGKAVGLVDMEDLDVDDDGTVDGLDEALDELKTEWPELFPVSKRRKTSVAGRSDRQGDAEKKPGSKDPSAVQAAILKRG